uniref:Guanylate cyclase domain-containing protein n=1 Tax=Dunaliella tertiolecta TaxID=3047 RepID=A0A7S3R719_DUNTE
MGEHMLGKGQEQVCMQLYQVLPRQLVHRAAQLGPVRSIHQLSHGFLEAPSNSAAICFMNVSYMKALELWNPDVTAAALKLWHTTVQGILIKRGGYLVEAADGLCLAAFTRPSSAIRWALESIEACLNADWPPELLETELGEEHYYSPLQWTGMPQYSERDQQLLSTSPSMESAAKRRPAHFKRVLLFRGLRLKVGIDWGAVKADLHAATARVDFRGKVMNRAARISSVAKCSQVWCSEGAWEAAAQDINSPKAFPDEAIEEGEDDNAAGVNTKMHGIEPLSKPKIRCVRATPLGPHHLKGIAQQVELYHCY